MSVNEITAEETGKIAGILEIKWADMLARNTRLTAENESLSLSLDLMTVDRNQWRSDAEQLRRERDTERDNNEFMLRQWQNIYALAEETKTRVLGDRVKSQFAPNRTEALAHDDPPPKVVVFNRD
jgi:hypothetical protein